MTFETPKVHEVKNLKGWKIYSCSALLWASILLVPHNVFSQGKDYAVEVAALSSRDCADELVNGLVARGMDAYWLKTNQPKFGDFYRVRVGKFSNLDSARRFAESLLDSGLLDTFSITDYEAPLYALMMSGSKRGKNALLPIELRNTPIGAYCPINLSDRSDKNSSKPEAVIAEIGNNRWSLSPAASTTPTMERPGSSARDHELKNAIDAIIASTQAAMGSIRPKVNMAINLTALDTGINKTVNKLLGERDVTARNNNINNNNINIEQDIRANRQLATVPSTASLTAFLPRTERSSFAGSGRPSGRAAVGDLSPGPRLRSVIEMNNGQMVLKLRNLDQQKSFSGLARLTLSDDSDTNDIAPVAIELGPEEEKVVPINDVKRAYGDLMLMVYDQRQAVQLIRSVQFGERPAGPRSVVAENREEGANTSGGEPPPVDSNTWKITDVGGGNSPSVEVSGVTQQGGSNVTGTFDATKPTVPDAVPGQPGNSVSQNTDVDTTSGQFVVSPRQTSITAENVTMEVGITGQQPIGYVKVSIKAGAFQDEKIAVFPNPDGSVQFLIPAKDATGQYSYEITNDAGKVIGRGVQNFSPAGPDS
jgi:SPOR domain